LWISEGYTTPESVIAQERGECFTIALMADPHGNTRPARKSRSAWNWLLAIPLLALVFPGIYARQTPELFGFPFFYWYQMAWILLTGLVTAVVFLVVKE
jgi:hypothetical protein